MKKKSVKQFRSSHFRTDRVICFREIYSGTRDIRVLNESSILSGIELVSGLGIKFFIISFLIALANLFLFIVDLNNLRSLHSIDNGST
jgi:hypothetical protein